jgi:hypothetical protein
MTLLLERYKQTDKCTFGRLSIDGAFECYTLEDVKRDKKVYGKTRIPNGIYIIESREHGGHYDKYIKRFTSWHKGMMQIMDVKNFTDILIHIGNTDTDTNGCILVGDTVSEKSDTIGQSTIAYERLYKKCVDLMYEKRLVIEIIDVECV